MSAEAAVSFFLNMDGEAVEEEVSVVEALEVRLNVESSLVMPLPPVLLRRTCSVDECGCSSDVSGEWLACGVCSESEEEDVGAVVGEVKNADCSCADGVDESVEEAEASDDSGESGASRAGEEEEGRLPSASASCPGESG